MLFNIITLVIRTSEAYVVISYRHGLSPRVEVQRVLRVQIVNQPEPADYSAVPRPPELRQDLAVGGDRRCGVGIGKGKYGPRRLTAAPQVVRRLSCPRDREHFLSGRTLVLGHGGDQRVVGRAAEDHVAAPVVAARFRVFDRRDDRFPGKRVEPRPRVKEPVLNDAEFRFDESEL